MNEPDVRQNAGRCDWCGKPVDMSSGDRLMITAEEDFEEYADQFTVQQLADAVADAVERVGGPKDEMVAESLREEHAFRLHERCYQKSSVSDVYPDEMQEEP